MARTRRPNEALRTIVAFFVLMLALATLLVGVHWKGTAGLAPKLGLDLEGGTQLVLEPRLVGNQRATTDQVNQARDIIVQRVDSQGVSGAEVTTQGENNIVVSMPGNPDRRTEDALRRSSQMQFRPVLASTSGVPTPTPTASPGTSTSPTSGDSGTSGTDTGTPTSTSTSTSSSNERKAADSPSTSTSTSSATSSTSSSSSVSGSESPSSGPTSAVPTGPTDLAWITDDLAKQFQELDCTKDGATDAFVDDPEKPLIACASDKSEKYILGPVVVGGSDISDAVAGYQTGPTGQPTNIVEIALTFRSEAAKKYGDISALMVNLPAPQNRLASTLDSAVIVAPSFNEAIPGGRASITGGFSFESAQELANQLKFGALPLSFDLQTRSQISPTLGEEQLRLGLVAGIIGLILVVGYSLFQYRMLGLVTVGSIVVAATLTYLVITILGWAQNFRLDMAGVTGLIVAIGVTADSFIVYFERVRDEVREGRTLRTAVDTGWKRARRTILAADGVNFLGALVLYLLASSSVRGFAFTLGLTTLIDILVVFMFTHPLVSLLARTSFFAGGHKWSGLDPERLGAKSFRYAGRGQVRPPRVSPAGEGSRA